MFCNIIALLIVNFCIALSDKVSDQLIDYKRIEDKKYSIRPTYADVLTTLTGRPIGDKTDLLTAGPRGPALLQDIQFIEEIAHFDRERLPERVVHAKGAGAFGVFRCTQNVTKYTKAAPFRFVGKETPVAVRFSTVVGESGSADTVFGDPRGFAVKFYTEEGNWDIVGNNVPMFFIRDAQMFSSFVHSQKRNPQTGIRDPNMQWDFITLRPETLHLITYLYSDFGIPDGFRHMPGFSINAFRLVNNESKVVFAKFHWITKQGIKNLDIDTAARLRADEPDYARRDLFNAIANKNFPSWTLKFQIMTEAEADKFEYNPFDATKIWPEDKFPLIDAGVMTLNENPENFFSDIEQMAVCPANLIPGVETSPDKLLLGRLFSYFDTQRYRLGVNSHIIPVNRAKNRVVTPTQRDGFMRTDGNLGAQPTYYPNSYSNVRDNPVYLESRIRVLADTYGTRYDSKNEDNYSQVNQTYWGFDKDMRQRLHRNLAIAISGADKSLQDRAIQQFTLVDPTFAKGIKEAIANLNSKNNRQARRRRLSNSNKAKTNSTNCLTRA